jgi:hypothetical protein
LLFCFVLSSTGVWTWGFVLATQVLYHLKHISIPFGSGYFGDRVLIFVQDGLNCDPLFYTSCWHWDDRCTWTVCQGCPKTMILQISTSQIAWIIIVSHKHPSRPMFYAIHNPHRYWKNVFNFSQHILMLLIFYFTWHTMLYTAIVNQTLNQISYCTLYSAIWTNKLNQNIKQV